MSDQVLGSGLVEKYLPPSALWALEDVLGRLPTLLKFSCAPYNLSPGGPLHASPPLPHPHPHPVLEEIDTREQSPVPTLQDRAGESLEPGDQLEPPRRELNSC